MTTSRRLSGSVSWSAGERGERRDAAGRSRHGGPGRMEKGKRTILIRKDVTCRAPVYTEITKGKKSVQLTSGHNVVIVSALEEKDVQWLLRAVSSGNFREQVKNLNFINIMKMKEKELEKRIAEHTFCIYVSSEFEWTQGASASQRVKSLSAQGKKNLVVVIDDVKTDSNEENRILAKCPDINKYARGVFLFSQKEKELDYQRTLYNSVQPGPDIAARGSQAQAIISPKVVFGKKHKVGIFSRSGERDFSWLMTLLTSEAFRDHVLSVRPCPISNNGYQQFNEDLAHCTFGILYHTKNFGRANLTDLMDSLYDEEIQHLSMTLEKKNIIVVIDDVEDVSDREKSRILHTQPKIAAYASDLILISNQDKTDNMGQPAKSKILLNFLTFSDGRLGFPAANAGYENQRGSVSYPSLERSRPPSFQAPPELPDSLLGSQRGSVSYPSLERSRPPSYQASTELPDSLIGSQRGSISYPSLERSRPPSYQDSTKLPDSLIGSQGGSVFYPYLERSRPPSYKAPPELPASFMRSATSTPSRSTIGIFSRSEEAHYVWLKRLLTSEESGHKDVLCCKISGNDKEVLRDAAFKSKFGILYHSVKNGKIRLTDVKDSQYHEELEQLSAKLGKRKIIVVIDDLDNSGHKIKQKILEKQPSLGRLAAEIFLFTAAEKKEVDLQGKSKSKMSKSTRDKISDIKKCLT